MKDQAPFDTALQVVAKLTGNRRRWRYNYLHDGFEPHDFAQGSACDAVGNRLSQESMVGGLPSMVSCLYDRANRLTDVNGVTYTWDNKG